MSEADSRSLFYILDKDGLITKDRRNLDELRVNFDTINNFARDEKDMEGMGLYDLVKKVKPNILIGIFYIIIYIFYIFIYIFYIL